MKISRGLLVILGCFALNTYAGVMPSQSRIIYKSQEKEISLMLANTNAYPVIVQTWIDKGEGTPDVNHIPFVSIPPVFRLESAGVKGIRIIYTQAALPKDKETLFWFNIYEIPPQKQNIKPDNRLLVTINTQIKLFYRPQGMTVIPQQAIEKVSCRRQEKTTVVCQNPTPLHLSVIDVQLKYRSGVGEKTIGNERMLRPFSRTFYQFSNIRSSLAAVALRYIDDGGMQQEYVVPMGADTPATDISNGLSH